MSFGPIHLSIDDDTLFGWIANGSGPVPRSTREIIKCLSEYMKGLRATYDVETELNILRDHEPILFLSDKRYRDHVRHACRVAVLGDLIMSGTIANTETSGGTKEIKMLTLIKNLLLANPRYSELFKLGRFSTSSDDFDKFLLRTWYTAALLHDVGYAFDAYVQTRKNIKFFEKFAPIRDFFMAADMGVSELGKGLSNPSFTGKASAATDPINHARIGARYVEAIDNSDPALKIASHMIYLHDSDDSISFAEDPLAFLLVLIDEVQEWGRPLVDKASLVDAFEPKEYVLKALPIELQRIIMSSDDDQRYVWDLSKHNTLALHFTLDYDDQAANLLQTRFNLPLGLYSKQKALARLSLGDKEKLQRVLNDNLKVPNVGFDVSVDILARDALSQEWDRQIRHLYAYANRKTNPALGDWTTHLMKCAGFRFFSKQFTINISQSGDLRPPSNLQNDISESYDSYVLDKEIQDSGVIEKVKYKKEKDVNTLVTTFNVERIWRNASEPRKTISEAVVTLGDVHPRDFRDALHHVRINRKQVDLHNVTPVVFPKSEDPLVDQLGLTFPFDKLLAEQGLTSSATVEYEYHMKLPTSDLDMDTYTNMRKRSTDKATIEVEIERSLAETLIMGGYPTRGTFSDMRPERTKILVDKIKRKVAYGIPIKGYVPLQDAIHGNVAGFTHTFENILTYETVGWLWIKK